MSGNRVVLSGVVVTDGQHLAIVDADTPDVRVAQFPSSPVERGQTSTEVAMAILLATVGQAGVRTVGREPSFLLHRCTGDRVAIDNRFPLRWRSSVPDLFMHAGGVTRCGCREPRP